MRRTTPYHRLVLFALIIVASVTTMGAAIAAARPWLGVYTQEITTDLRDGLDLNGDGVLVNRVVAGGPAERAGIRKGDVIVRFEAHAVESPAALAEMVGDARSGQLVSVDVLRAGERRTMRVTLAARPSADTGDEDQLAPPSPPDAPEAPDAPGQADDEDAPRDRAHREVRVHVVTPDDPHGKAHVYRIDGDADQLPPDVHQMLRGMNIEGLDKLPGTPGMRRIVVNAGDRVRLGVRIEPLSEDLASALDAPGTDGVLVLSVIDDTPAARAGIKAGDVITGVNNRGVRNAEELQKALRDVDGRVSISVSRNGSRRTIEAELGSARTGRGEGSPGSGRMEEHDRVMRLRDRDSGSQDGLRREVDELRQQLRELRQQLEEQRDHR